jgi:hypothetical protein
VTEPAPNTATASVTLTPPIAPAAPAAPPLPINGAAAKVAHAVDVLRVVPRLIIIPGVVWTGYQLGKMFNWYMFTLNTDGRTGNVTAWTGVVTGFLGTVLGYMFKVYMENKNDWQGGSPPC